MKKVLGLFIVLCFMLGFFGGLSCIKAAKPVVVLENKRLTTAPGGSLYPAAAWSGAGYGVVWSDDRDGGEPAVYFARINNKGNKVGGDLKLSNSTNISYNPKIVWNGTDYGVIWSDYNRYDADNAANGCSLIFARVSSTGAKIGGNIQVTWDDYGICPGYPQLVWNGAGYGVFWHENRLGTGTLRVYMVSLNLAGIKTSGDIQLTDFYSGYRRAVWNGTGYALLLLDIDSAGNPQNSYLARYDLLGNRIGSEQMVLPSIAADDMLGADFAWDGTGYGILFLGSVDNVRQEYFMRVGANGSILVAGTQITNNLLPNGGLLPEKMIWGNNAYAVTMSVSDSYVYFMEVSTSGTVKTAAYRIDNTTRQAKNPVAIWANGKYAIFWDDSRYTGLDSTGNVEIFYAIFQPSRK